LVQVTAVSGARPDSRRLQTFRRAALAEEWPVSVTAVFYSAAQRASSPTTARQQPERCASVGKAEACPPPLAGPRPTIWVVNAVQLEECGAAVDCQITQ